MSELESEIYFYLSINGPTNINVVFVYAQTRTVTEYLKAVRKLIDDDYIKSVNNVLSVI